MKQYSSDPTPGDFDHRGGNCPIHGENVPTFRAKKRLGPFLCVECALEELRKDIKLGDE